MSIHMLSGRSKAPFLLSKTELSISVLTSRNLFKIIKNKFLLSDRKSPSLLSPIRLLSTPTILSKIPITEKSSKWFRRRSTFSFLSTTLRTWVNEMVPVQGKTLREPWKCYRSSQLESSWCWDCSDQFGKYKTSSAIALLRCFCQCPWTLDWPWGPNTQLWSELPRMGTSCISCSHVLWHRSPLKPTLEWGLGSLCGKYWVRTSY